MRGNGSYCNAFAEFIIIYLISFGSVFSEIIKPNSFMLIHQLSSGFWGKMEEIKDEFINLKKLMKKLKGIYKEHTSIKKDELIDLLKRDLWLDSGEALNYGLVDRVE